VLAGYRKMAHELRCAFDRGDGIEGHLIGIARQPARYVVRTTWFYGRLLLESLSPARLRDGIAREISLERLWRAPLVASVPVKIVERELEAVRQLDVPTFCFDPRRGVVIAADGTEIEGVLPRASVEELVDRAKRISDRPLEKDLDLVRSAVSCVFQTIPLSATTRTRSRKWRRPVRRSVGNNGWLDHAVEIGELILGEAQEGDDGGLSWAGVCLDPLAGTRSVAPLPPDLLSGTCGIALLFADLYRLTGSSIFEIGLDGTLVDIQREVEEWSSRAATRGRRRIYCGAFCGLGAPLYTLLRCARIPKYQGLRDAVARCVLSLPSGELERLAAPDVVTGRAGLLMSLSTRTRTEPALRAATELVQRLGRNLMAWREQKANDSASFSLSGTPVMPGLPDDKLGIDLALLRWSAHEEPGAAERIVANVAGEMRRRNNQDASGIVASGRLLGALAASQFIGDFQAAFVDEVKRALTADTTTLSSAMLLEATELAATGFQMTDESWFHDRARAYAESLIQRRGNDGSWFPESFAPDRQNFSTISGIPAVAHVLLKLYSPGEVPSIRILN
jgi:lantibiotic modifying enzyme